jgi:ankyrin repeat protein
MKNRIGEKILVAQGIVRFGTKAGMLDLMLGEKDIRRRVIDGQNIDPESDEYLKLCEDAYEEFLEKSGLEEIPQQMLEDLDQYYNSALTRAQKNDQINWSEIFANSLLLGNSIRSAVERTNPNFLSTTNNPLVTFSADLSAKAPQEFLAKIDLPQTAQSTQLKIPTFNEALSWLNRNSGGLDYSILTFTALRMAGAGTIPAFAAATISSLATTEAAKNYKTTVFCGPKMDCSHLREAAKDKRINLIETDEKELVTTKKYDKVKRLVIAAHGSPNAMQEIATRQELQADDFAAQFFPSVQIIHAIGCRIGTNPTENFAQNSLKHGQILFLHAGKEQLSVGITNQISSYLTLDPSNDFPPTTPIQILLKFGAETTFVELTLPSLEEIAAASDDIENLYEVISSHISNQKQAALEKLENRSDSIAFELEKIGYIDRTTETDLSQKTKLVQDYLVRYLQTVATQDNVSESQLNQIELILKSGFVDVDYLVEGQTLAIAAATNGHRNLLELLGKYGADFNKQNHVGWTPAVIAASQGHYDCLAFLINQNVDLDIANENGETPIIAATVGNHEECLKLLIDNGADVNKVTQKQLSAAIVAAKFGHSTCLEMLAQNNADLNINSQSGENAATVAASYGKSECLDVLGRYGVDLSKPDKTGTTGKTAASIIARNNDLESLKVLVKHSVNFNEPTGAMPPLLMASYFGRVEFVKTLLNNGAKADISDRGITALSLALSQYEKSETKSDFLGVITSLIRSGANPEEERVNKKPAYEHFKDDPLLVATMQSSRQIFLQNEKKEPGKSPSKTKESKAKKTESKLYSQDL